MSCRRVLLSALCVLGFVWSSNPSAAFGTTYQLPIDGPVVDRFRAPMKTYGPGNRGWEYAVEGSAAVRAPADGTVTFAGQVGGTLNVVIQHSDGLRTTLSRLASIAAGIRVDAFVHSGDTIGLARDHLFFGVRCGSSYWDPASLFERRVHLVGLGDDRVEAAAVTCASEVTASTSAWLATPAPPTGGSAPLLELAGHDHAEPAITHTGGLAIVVAGGMVAFLTWSRPWSRSRRG